MTKLSSSTSHRSGPRIRRALFEPLDPRLMLSVGGQCREDTEAPAELVGDSAAMAAGSIQASDAGSTAGTAFDLGRLGAARSLGGSVGALDLGDVLRFTLAEEARVEIRLTGLWNDIDVALYDGNGRLISGSFRAGTASESITATLDAGVYYIAVTPWRRAFSTYVLSVGATVTQPPGNDTPPNNGPPSNEERPPGDDPPPTDDPPPVSQFPDVAYYGGSNEWNLNVVGAPESWAQGYTGQDVVVAVVDTGVDVNHPDLVNQIWVNAGEIAGNGIDDDGNGFVDDVSGWDFAGGDNNPDDVNGHGTHVAGTIAADDNGFGATGVAPDATIMPVRVLGDNGSGTAAGVAAGIRYAAANGADVINLSLGGGFSRAIFAAIEYALELDVLVVAAAGNESASVPGYPARFAASLSNVIAVGAHSSAGAIASFSNLVGTSGAAQVDAPGVSVYSTYAGGRYGRLSGTSMAAPHVAGLAALALSANGNLTSSELRTLIVDGADRTIAGSDSLGGINAAVTVALAAAGNASVGSRAAAPSPSSNSSISVRRFLASSAPRTDSMASAQMTTDELADSWESSGADYVARVATKSSELSQTARDLALLAMQSAADEERDALDTADMDPLFGFQPGELWADLGLG